MNLCLCKQPPPAVASFLARSPCLNLNTDCDSHFCCAPLTCARTPWGPKVCLSEPAAPSEVYIATQGKEVDFHIVKPGFTGGNNISEW